MARQIPGTAAFTMTTREVAALCFVHPQTIRVWEKKGLISPALRISPGIYMSRRRWLPWQVKEIIELSNRSTWKLNPR